jgi:hypothetical protein
MKIRQHFKLPAIGEMQSVHLLENCFIVYRCNQRPGSEFFHPGSRVKRFRVRLIEFK